LDRRVFVGRQPEAPSGRQLRRRAFIGMAVGSVLASCSSSSAKPSSQRPPTAGDDSGLPGSGASSPPSPQPSAEARTGEPTASEVARAEIVARYAGVEPVAWGLDVPGVVNRLPTQDRVVALTFDACGGGRGSGYDAALIEALQVTQTPATLFLNKRWILAHPEVTARLVSQPLFEIANHGTQHRPLSVTGRSAYGITGTGGPGEVYDEVSGNRRSLTEATGIPPRFFRSGTAHYDDVAVRITRDLGEAVVNFDVNGDAGATLTPQGVAAALESAAPGSIVLCHMNQPGSGTARGVATALPRLARAGFRFVHLSDYLV
jgi:peptidoglycan/xylan/chitin deacetylase (PgdA/CDA1 family)